MKRLLFPRVISTVMEWDVIGLAGLGAHPCGQDKCHTPNWARLITCVILELGLGLRGKVPRGRWGTITKE